MVLLTHLYKDGSLNYGITWYMCLKKTKTHLYFAGRGIANSFDLMCLRIGDGYCEEREAKQIIHDIIPSTQIMGELIKKEIRGSAWQANFNMDIMGTIISLDVLDVKATRNPLHGLSDLIKAGICKDGLEWFNNTFAEKKVSKDEILIVCPDKYKDWVENNLGNTLFLEKDQFLLFFDKFIDKIINRRTN